MTIPIKPQPTKRQSFKLKHSLLILSLAAAYPLQANAASAGVAQFTAGDVNLRGADGQTSPLIKGKDIESGQAILTGTTGRAQVRFTDGGVISLQPNTEFKIASYVDKLDGKEDRFLVDLLRGSMRAITGLIGKRNRDNYRVTTTTATIGIRGSGFTAGYNPDGSLGVTAEKDAIEVCNAGVCVGLVAGESVRVIDKITPPSRTVNKAAIPTPGPAQDTLVAGNQTNNAGISKLLPNRPLVEVAPVPVPVPTPVPEVLVSGPFYNLTVKTSYSPGGEITTFNPSTSQANSIVTLNDGRLQSYTESSSNLTFNASSNPAGQSRGSISERDFIGWGYWASGNRTISPYTFTANNLHYVVGIPTATMPTTAGTVFYTFVGGSAPTDNTGATGVLNSATFNVNFDSRSYSYDIRTTLGNMADTSNPNTISGNTFASLINSNAVQGFFAGPNAKYVGLTYAGPRGGGTSTYSGSVVFKK